METVIEVLEKGASLELDLVSKQEGPKSYYFGAGWDCPNGPVDLDIVAVALRGGKLAKQSDLVYYGNRTGVPGIALSEDNTTGEGEGDDESIVINTAALESDVDRIVVGLACYRGADFATAPNPHFRACDGNQESSPQITDVPAGNGESGDTVLAAFQLDREANGWKLTNIGTFHKKGNGVGAIQGFAGLFS